MKILIHTCKEREWYVNEYLIPSIVKQGIKKKDIEIWLDTESIGNLASWLASCEYLADKPGGTWHLQDDVLISRNFAKQIKKHDTGIVCGFCYAPYETQGVHTGVVFPVLMWQSSFQCIRIPNHVLKHFLEWYNSFAIHDHDMQEYISLGKCDDTIFRIFMIKERSTDKVLNLKPHLVEHVDVIIGGSVINRWRNFWANGTFFEDHDLVEELEKKLGKERT